ncbi:cilia- and flagella-associated protein 47-like [Pholidichthys leucotaenia]
MASSCIRVEPPAVEFNNVEVGQVYRTTVTARNVGKTLKKIIIEQPVLKLFKFIPSGPALMVAPGLSVSGSLEFCPEEEEEITDCLLIHIDDAETLEIPLKGLPRACSLLMDSTLDFGCVAANSQVISKHHPITNQGSAPGVFQVKYTGDSWLQIAPSCGIIAAGSTQWLQVELRTDRPRQIEEKARVKLQNHSSVVLSIRAEIVEQRLEVFDMKGTPVSCLRFGPIYFGTSHMEKVILRNNAPQPCDWVCLLQDTVAGTELGTDLQKSTDAALLEGMKRCSPDSHNLSQVLVCVPNQGRLGPYEKIAVTVLFSPVCKSLPDVKKHAYPASRQDYSLFLLFECVGSKHGFTYHNANSSLELAVTGSGLPVSLVPSPSYRFDFLSCVTGQRVSLLCVLKNLCPQLPISFCFRKLAHFTTEPCAGTIAPGQCQDVILTFNARQQGRFHMRQKLDILGQVVCQRDRETSGDTAKLELGSFHTVSLHLSAVCHSQMTHPIAKVNPALTNPVLSRPHVQFRELTHFRGVARAAILCANKTDLHRHQNERNQNMEGEDLVAFPDNRASSIRPASSHRQYRTIFTGVPRYHYVDNSYAFTDQEEAQRQRHCQIYVDFIKQHRQKRLQIIKDREQKNLDNDVDIGIAPGQGLVPPKLCVSDFESSKISETNPSGSPEHKFSYHQDLNPIAWQISELLNAVPATSQEVADCNKTLTARQLHQVVIDPLFVDFGKVCVQSVCVQKLELINHLSMYIWVQLKVDCPELQGSSPLSHVLPPRSHITLLLTFQSSNLGSFNGPVSYTVNQQHPGQILVQAQVVPMALELSTNMLVLHSTPNLLTASGYRSSVTLINNCNKAAEFTWRPLVTENGILFSVRPATGVVEPHKELDCEVVWHPSFSAPSEGDFDLCVHEGNTQRLHCVAKVGITSVQLAEKQITFGSVPLNMLSTRSAVLHNTGQNHAFYQILDLCPLPGMTLSPSEGVVPSKGQVVLNIHFNPEYVIRFDTRIEIALRNLKSIELRVGGSVEPPNVDISVSHFQFYGVHAGSQQVIPFTLANHSPAAARVTFDLSDYEDFSLQLPQSSATERAPGVSIVEVLGFQTVDCSLVFSPTEVVTYDFDLPLMVNGVRWPTALLPPFPTPSCSSTSSTVAADSRRHRVKSGSHVVTMAAQQSPHIQASVLCAPLEMTPSTLQFHVEPQSDIYTKKVELKAAAEERVCWQDIGECVHWWFDHSATATPAQGREEGELCEVSPSSGSLGPGQSICLVVTIRPEAIRRGSERITQLLLPLYLGDKDIVADNGHHPYRELSISITLQWPSITIHPPQILLTPVPLERDTATTLTLLAVGYPGGTSLSVEVDEVEMEDGTKIQPVCASFPDGNTIPAQKQIQEGSVASVLCSVSFSFAMPLSLCTTVTFVDHLNNRFKVKLCATADNCLLTVWPHMALHHSEQQVVLKTGLTSVEAILQCYQAPSPVSGLTSSSSSFDHNSTNKTSDSFPDSNSASSQVSRETEISPTRDSPTNLGLPEFPVSNSEEGLYYQKVLLAVERWFSLFGWPSGMYLITIPHTLRRVVSKNEAKHSKGQTYRVSQNRDSRSAVDMLHHLTGRQIPGIPHCQIFSTDIDQRTNKLLQQHEAMLAFLRVQGACLCHVRPEYLLDVLEFKHWCSVQSIGAKHGLDYSCVDYESLSKRAWIDVLLQIYKVLVLPRVSKRDLDTTSNHIDKEGFLPVSTQTLASNIYSSWEIQLLSWLNMHFQNMRKTVWSTCGVPPAHWIVNFDLDLTDGLVLAAVLAAYCPYLIGSHFQRMYTTTSSLEQILHNNIIVTQALTTLCLNMNIQPADLSDPNPVQMLMLCVHLYERLPQYLTVCTITLSGALHSTFSKQVRLKNPASKPVKFQVLVLGEDAHLFSLPGGSKISIPPKSSTEVTVHFRCSFLQPMEAVLLFVSCFGSGLSSATLAFKLETHISHITPTKTIKCTSQCYQLKEIQVPLINMFNKEAKFRVVLVESVFNPLEPETRNDSLVQQASSKTNIDKMTADKLCGEEMEDGEGTEFLSSVKSIVLSSGQADTLNIHYLPFHPGTKYCSMLLVCPQVGDMVYMVEATSGLPLASPLITKPSSNIITVPKNSELTLHCKMGQVCEEVLRVPIVNMFWEQALSLWGQLCMSTEERRRRILTRTLHSSTVRWSAEFYHKKEREYSVEVSLPQYFTLPGTVRIPVKEDETIPSENLADYGSMDIPFQFQADKVGEFRCEVVLRSCSDTRVYLLKAQVTSQEKSFNLDFSTPAHHSVTKHIPLHNETERDWKMQAKLCGEGFYGPTVLNVPVGTKADYPITFHPATQCTVMGKLALLNDSDSTEHRFTLRGVGERPLPIDHVILHCTVGKIVHKQLDVPNHTKKQLTLKVVTALSVVIGTPSLEIEPGHSATYTLTLSPLKRGKQTGSVSFIESDDIQDAGKDKGNAVGHYEVYFTLEIICEPATPIKIIDVQCFAQSSVAIEIPVNNPGGELLMLDVFLEGDDLSGANRVIIPPWGTEIYKAIFSPSRVGKSTGSVVFQLEFVAEFWYQLELYSLPLPLVTLPQACCHLGKWTKLTIPVVNPTAETLKLFVVNSNPRNYTLEMDSRSTLTVEPRSFIGLGVRFCPSNIGEGNHKAKITFICPQLQEWCVLLSGLGLKPETEEPLSISSTIGSTASIAIPFTNPTELPGTLTVTLTDRAPSETSSWQPFAEEGIFSVPLSCSDGLQISERETVDVPVIFAPNSVELQQALLCISLKPIISLGNKSNFATDSKRSEHELSICWMYPLCGVPMEDEISLLGLVQCEAGCQLEKKVDVLLTGYVPGNEDRKEQEVSVRIQTIVLAAILVLCSGVLAVKSMTGKIWEFPITLSATEPQVDDVIFTETTEIGATSAVAFRLTSTTRRPELFTAEILPGGSSSEFTVTPVSGMLPPVGSPGALITVSFTPTISCTSHKARLIIQAADMRWTYELIGKTPHDASPICNTSPQGSSSV